MAYDKVIDSSVLDGNLTSIANAIREKAELTDNFAFPQGFIDAISGIESGGGNIVYGTFTPAENIRTTIIQHNLGALPSFAMFFQKNNTARNDYSIFCCGGITNTSYFRFGRTTSNQISLGSRTRALLEELSDTNPCWIGSLTDNTMHIGSLAGTISYYLEGGVEYMWLVMP